MNVPRSPQRQLARVLRRRLQQRGGVRLQIGAVVAAPDSKHVEVSIAGANVVVPRLASYAAPVAGEACYLLAADSVVVALGAVR